MSKVTKNGKASRRSTKRRGYISTPLGVIQPRVEKVGPERFGIVAVDCAKARSKWMMCDFYGKVTVPPTVVQHIAVEFEHAQLILEKFLTRAAGSIRNCNCRFGVRLRPTELASDSSDSSGEVPAAHELTWGFAREFVNFSRHCPQIYFHKEDQANSRITSHSRLDDVSHFFSEE